MPTPSQITESLTLIANECRPLAFAWHLLLDAYESPFGLIPCPTLSLLVGVSLFADGFGSRAWMWCLTLVAAFYGVLGTVALSVWIDALLLAGALLLGVKALRQPGRIQNRLGDFSHAR